MRILLTGHLGNIGSRLAKQLDTYVGIDTKDGKNLLTCELPEEVDVIYHLAAHASVVHSWSDPVRTVENMASTVRLAHHYPEAKIIFASTGASIDPVTPYGFSKWACNEYLNTFHNKAVIMYFPNIFGIPSSVVDVFKDKEVVTIYGDGLQIRDYVHVDDIVKGLLLAKDWKPGKYYLGSGVGTNLLELAEGKEVIFKEARKEARESILENNTPNWKPSIDVLEYINE
jgi:nucleoside-diphosphate-sugar epimerase